MTFKTIQYCLVGIFLVIIGLIFQLDQSATGNQDKSIKWLSYEDGMALSKKENKKIFLHFFSTRCGWCKRMDKGPFSDDKIVSYINDNYIPIKVNNQKRVELTRQYSAFAVPNNWFIAENGERIANIPGFVPSNQFYKIISFISTNSYKTMTFQDYKIK